MKDKSIAISNERRKSLRYKFDGLVGIGLGDNMVNSHVRNMGRDGMFIEMPSPLSIGTVFTAQLALKAPVLIKCVVRRVEPGRGMGVSIVAPGTEGRKRLAAFLDTLAHE